ncbi:MAG: hypothetical protein SGJ02_07725, partial [bacterium]|nr:hypothetical protein [bacterium]
GKFSTDIGRQALSWGQGIVFQSLDVFNPFAPASIDTEYKTGQDMALISYSYDLNTQINALLVPRRDVISHDFESDKSSFVLRVQKRFEGTSYETQAIIAKHFDEPMIGLGISTTLLESVIRFDFALFDPDQGNLIPQAIINMDRSWEAFGINWYGYLEYFYSGSGTSSSNYSDLSERLLKKLEQGELFTLAENYLTTGFKQEITPLINLYELVILNLDDNSTLSQLKLTYDLTPNFTILSALTFGLGASGDEFQSLKLLNGGLLGRGDSFLLQGNYYF